MKTINRTTAGFLMAAAIVLTTGTATAEINDPCANLTEAQCKAAPKSDNCSWSIDTTQKTGGICIQGVEP